MQEYRYLLDIALILLMTKAFGLFSRRLRMPSVVGALIAGIVLGPAVLNIVEPSKLIESLSEIGVIVLMFAAGLETSITDLKKAGFKAFIIATLGVLVPLAVGYVVGGFYNVGPDAWLHNLFLGVILTATSVILRCYFNGNKCRYYSRNIKRNGLYVYGKWKCDFSCSRY